jgi:hypothetical protein
MCRHHSESVAFLNDCRRVGGNHRTLYEKTTNKNTTAHLKEKSKTCVVVFYMKDVRCMANVSFNETAWAN